MLFFSPWTCQALPNSEASTLNASFIRIDVVVLIGGFFAFLLFTTVIVFLYKHHGGQTTMISELLDAFESDRRERDENSARPTTDGSDEINRARDDANTHRTDDGRSVKLTDNDLRVDRERAGYELIAEGVEGTRIFDGGNIKVYNLSSSYLK
jgi:hypothetical protein